MMFEEKQAPPLKASIAAHMMHKVDTKELVGKNLMMNLAMLKLFEESGGKL